MFPQTSMFCEFSTCSLSEIPDSFCKDTALHALPRSCYLYKCRLSEKNAGQKTQGSESKQRFFIKYTNSRDSAKGYRSDKEKETLRQTYLHSVTFQTVCGLLNISKNKRLVLPQTLQKSQIIIMRIQCLQNCFEYD